MTDGGPPDPLYVRARRVLLDALAALAPFRNAVILVGAQAIYLHTGDSGLAVAPYTTDADLALDPELLVPDPRLETVLRAAGFAPIETEVGRWVGSASGGTVDLMGPEAFGGPGRRGARLGPHGNRAARKGRGLEAALVDKHWVSLTAFDVADQRRVDVWLAGSGALLVAKLHKLADRTEAPSRLADKDALDIYRLHQAIPTATLVEELQALVVDGRSAAVTTEATGFLRDLFGAANAAGSQMAGRALEPLEDPATVAAACAALTGDILLALG